MNFWLLIIYNKEQIYQIFNFHKIILKDGIFYIFTFNHQEPNQK